MKANQDYQRFLTETQEIEALDPTKKRRTVEQKKQTKMKKAISAYLYFCNAHRAEVKARHPEMKMVEIQRLLANKWMKASPSIKLPFEKQAAADRMKYNAEIKDHTNGEDDEATFKAKVAATQAAEDAYHEEHTMKPVNGVFKTEEVFLQNPLDVLSIDAKSPPTIAMSLLPKEETTSSPIAVPEPSVECPLFDQAFQLLPESS